ncbi:hypothetical protein BKI52_10395 [marine bacterium AO1-C]|nr:hypothetical protein BKI52_10395 [marine bacterium AO1-C]
MKKILVLMTWAGILCSFPRVVWAQKSTQMTHKDSLVAVVKGYYRLNVKVFQAKSTVDDINEIFKLVTNDFTYVHPKYGGVYTRQNLYDGYVRNQKNGKYNGRISDMQIVNMIVGLDAITVEKRFVFRNKDGSTRNGEPQMTLFEFKKGKISRIFEYN